MPISVTKNEKTAKDARSSLMRSGHDVSLTETQGVWVLFSATCADSTMASLGMSLQLAST